LRRVYDALIEAGAVPRYVGARLGAVRAADGAAIAVETTLEAMPSVLWDAVVLPDGEAAQPALLSLGQALEFVKDQYRHCKPLLVLGMARSILDAVGIGTTLPDGEDDPGVVLLQGDERRNGGLDDALSRFVAALARHRIFERETDPPPV
ncbi:MAG: catalase HPII, partial [Burkholderiaceae bacterium]|nr:catalase HPII [Burkholderiaceae bacterium]